MSYSNADYSEEQLNSFEETLNYIMENKRKRDSGGYNSIPFGLPALDRHVPGIMRGTQFIVTANSGVRLTKYLVFIFCSHNKV